MVGLDRNIKMRIIKKVGWRRGNIFVLVEEE